MPRLKIAPSILSADFGRINEEIKAIEKNADLIHVDVMDGNFVPNITIGQEVVKCLKTTLPLDVHLMIARPERHVRAFAEAGASIITVHQEASRDLAKTIRLIKASGCQASVSIKPRTPVSKIEQFLGELDMVLVMSVEPGFGGQKFMEPVLAKVRRLRALQPDLDLEIDGGINPDTAKLATAAGANVLVAGSYIFGQKDRQAAIAKLRLAGEK